MKDKTTATLLAFFLGAVGGHKFYLGRTGAGLMYFLFCWTFIPGFIAFFEFLSLLFMSSEEFNRRFNYQLQAYAPPVQHQIVINNQTVGTLPAPDASNAYQAGDLRAGTLSVADELKKLNDPRVAS